MRQCSHEFSRFVSSSGDINLTGLSCVKCGFVKVEKSNYCDRSCCKERLEVEGVSKKRYCSICLKGL